MQCPLCEAATKVLESRGAESGAAIRRRRECSGCGHRFTTYERREQALFVRKRNGRREAFDRAKLRKGLARAVHKRPVSGAAIDSIGTSSQSRPRSRVWWSPWRSTSVPMKTPRSWRRMTAYHIVDASLVPWMRSHGRGGTPLAGATPAAMSWCCVAT